MHGGLWNVTSADCQATEELVLQTLTLHNSREATVLNLLSVQLETVIGEFEPLLNKGRELVDMPAPWNPWWPGTGVIDVVGG